VQLDKEQKHKASIATALLIIVVAVMVFKPLTPNKLKSQQASASTDVASTPAIDQLLSDAAKESEASKALFQKVVDEDEIRTELEKMLGTNRSISAPQVAGTSIRISEASGKKAVDNYFEQSNQLLERFSVTVPIVYSPTNETVDPRSAERAISVAKKYNDQLSQLPVPREVVEIHKANMIIADEMSRVYKLMATADLTNIDDPWPQEAYTSYAIMNEQLQYLQEQSDAVTQKYAQERTKILGISLPHITFIKTAHAIFGLGSLRDFLEDLWTVLWTRFAAAFIQKTTQRIERSFAVSNVLFYTDALVAAQYAPDYLNKYFTTSDKGSSAKLDQEILKKKILQLGCGSANSLANGTDLDQVYREQSQKYLGFNPATIDVSSGDFYVKMAQAGQADATPFMRKVLYDDKATQVAAKAEQAAVLEQAGAQLKSVREKTATTSATGTGSSAANANNSTSKPPKIVGPKESITSALNGLAQNLLNLGHIKSFAAQFAAGIVGTIFTNFVFKDAVVVKEQVDCGKIEVNKNVSEDGSQGVIKLTKQVRNITPLSPNLNLQFGSTANVSPNDLLEYKITLSSTKDLKKVSVKDDLALGLKLIDGSVLVDGQARSWATSVSNIVLDDLGGKTVTITYQAQVLDVGGSGLKLDNFVNVSSGDYESEASAVATIR
jgi:hypothetical protein